MKYLIDTNVLLRWAQAESPDYALCADAVNALLEAGDAPCICAQVLIEFWAVATRPSGVNGLGLTPPEASEYATDIRGMFTCLSEPPDAADQWQEIVERYSVCGRQVHDARIVALMQTHGLSHIVTFNGADFARYEGITPVSPQELANRPIP